MSTSLKQLMEQDAQRPVSRAPIDDVLAGGKTRLRRRRVVAVAAAAIVALLAIAVPIGLVGGDDSVDEPIQDPERSDSLTFTREDGTTFTIDGARVHCPPPKRTETASQAILVVARGKAGYFVVEGLLAEVSDGATIRLPATFEKVFDGQRYRNSYFFAVGDVSKEMASDIEGASGTLVFERASCEPRPAIDMRIDATLQNPTFEGQRVQVDGRVTLGYGS
jgi:hypothetical protein